MLRLISVFLLSLALGCGGPEEGSPSETKVPATKDTKTPGPQSTDEESLPDNTPATFTCADDLSPATCTARTQYCIVHKKYRITGGVSTDGQCAEKPSGCNDCECASEDAPQAFTRVRGGCQNATVLCSNKNGTMTVTCETR